MRRTKLLRTALYKMTVYQKTEEICRAAKKASVIFSIQNTQKKNQILFEISKQLGEKYQDIIEANKNDLISAKENGISDAMLDRLMLDKKRIDSIRDSLISLIKLSDPIGTGELLSTENGLEISCERVPIGVVALIYESRPNVTVDAAALCIKTGNAVVLRGGREAVNTNLCLISIMKSAIEACGICPDILGFIEPGANHESADALMSMRGIVDVLIPRGSKRLIDSVVSKSKIPTIETGAGNCHLYVDASADLEMAVSVAVNAKCSRPAVCNAIETLLVHSSVAEKFLPAFRDKVTDKYCLEIRGCERTQKILNEILPATEDDYATEFDDYILAVKIVDSTDEAIEHINRYNTGHSEAIITNSASDAIKFRKLVDAAAVYVNASTRFTDGGEFGFGAEIGISTQKLHARGPMGLMALTTQKYLITGEGQIR